MKTDKKIYQLKLKLKELKSGGHVSPESLEGLVPVRDLKKLFLCWYDEKPLDQIAKPEAIVKYEEMIATADSLWSSWLEINRNKHVDIDIELLDERLLVFKSAFQFLVKEQEKDPDLYLWLDATVPKDTEGSFYIPLTLGTDCCFVPRGGYGFCPSSATLSTKISALEEALKKVCDRYESKVLESFMVDSVCQMSNRPEELEILNSFT